jgi:hypothetical protein
VLEREIQISIEAHATPLQSKSGENGPYRQHMCERGKEGLRFVETVLLAQEVTECDHGVHVARVEFERLAQRLLVTGVHQLIDDRRAGR